MTQLNPIPTEEQVSAEDNQQLRNASRIAAIILGSTLIMTVFLLFLAWQARAWQLYAVVGIVIVMDALAFGGLRVVRGGRIRTGMLIVISGTVFVLPFVPLLISDLGLILGFVIPVMSYFYASQSLQTKDTRRILLAGISIGILVAATDLLNLEYRLQVPVLQAFTPVLVGSILLIITFFIAREAWYRNNIRSRFLTYTLGLTLVAAAVIAGISVSSLLSAGQQAQETSSQALRNQVEDFLNHQTIETASKNDLILQSISQDAEDVAQQAANILEKPNAFNTESFWQANDYMFVGPEGQYINGENDTSTVFIPNTVVVDDNFVNKLETLAYLNMAFVPVYEGNPNTVAIYFVGRDEISWLYPNINLGALVPADYLATQDIFYTSGNPENNPERQVVWTPVYDDPGGQGLLVSAIAPVYVGDTFEGVIGIDVSLAGLTANIETEDFGSKGTYAFLLDSDGRALALPDQAYIDLLGREREPAEFGVDFANSARAEFAPVIKHILSGEPGFHSVFIDDQEYLVAHESLNSTNWYLVSVASAEQVLAPATAVRTELEDSSNTLVFQRILPVGLAFIALVVVAGIFFTNLLVKPIEQLTEGAAQIGAGKWNTSLPDSELKEISGLSRTLSKMASQIKGTLETLEQRVAERTENLELAAEVGRTVSQVSDLDIMLTQAAQLILEQFDLYYVQVYLTDLNRTSLKLEAGTGEVGAQLREHGHSLPLSTASINGRAAVEKRAVVISDTAESLTFRPNPLLPDTRGEMALPLVAGDEVVGVLDLQTRYPGKLTEELLPAYEALAGQLAVAIQNAILLQEAEQARAEVEAQARRQIRASWGEHLDAVHKPEQIGFVYNRNEVLPLVDQDELTDESQAISAPISLTGEELGSLVVELDDESKSEQNSELISIVARQVAQQLENLRLLESAERYRIEAEQAARRQTREGWQEYLNARSKSSLGYLYDLKEVRPNSNGHEDASALTLPLKVRDEAIGKMSIKDVPPDDREAVELVNAVAERLSAHIESLRQYDRTQTALTQSERLFDASRSLTQAADLQELVMAVVTTLGISEVNRALLTTFDYDEEDEVEQLTVVANWWNETGNEVTPIGTRYALEVIQTMPMFVSPTPVFFNDAFNDERVDGTTMEVVKRLNLRAVAVLPLHLGSGQNQIGALILEAEEPHNFTPDETRLFESLAPQIATVLENRQQFEKAQRQAERETMLNTINQKIQSATSVEAVLQIAARELGHALGAPMTIAQLSMQDKN